MKVTTEFAKQESQAPTEAQRKVLSFVYWRTVVDGFPPTMREIGQALGYSPRSVGARDHLYCLERKGLVERDPVRSRGRRVTSAGKRYVAVVRVEADVVADLAQMVNRQTECTD